MDEVSKKQSEFKSWLKKIRISQNDFADLFMYSIEEESSEEQIKKFQEKFKKQLNRKTTSLELLDAYLNFLFSLEKFKEAGFVRPQSYSDDILEPSAARMMKCISKKLTQKYQDEEYEDQ
ncbi:MAG: hypothetical protein PHI97_09085 [Desulfobulbus sp.]|nr:hypothetical protein [Desulfobulbus sp.]